MDIVDQQIIQLSQLKWSKTTNTYKELKYYIDNDKEFNLALQSSLILAKEKADKELHPNLYHAIDNVFGGNSYGWPTTPNHYLEYIAKFMVLIPNEIDDPKYPNAWKSDNTQNGYNQKVYDLLCQFYFLINQPLPNTNKTLQAYKRDHFIFADWLCSFAINWGEFLDTKGSLTSSTLASFKSNPMYNFPLYSENSKHWKSFNTFFYRQFNGANKKGQTPLRPIAEPNNNNTITSPADCTFKEMYHIDNNGNVLGINEKTEGMTLKNTHRINSVSDLLQDEKIAKAFHGGTFVHYFLSPFDYHRFHAPVNGTVKESKVVRGKVYLDVEFKDDGQFHAPDNSENGYEFQQTRGVFIVDAGEPLGLVAVIPTGMAQVSGVDMYTQLKGTKINKGDEFGKFMFGGSDTILLFQKNPNLYLWKTDPAHNPIHFQFGQVVAYWNIIEGD